ncbi:hypothetical protein FKP32DRAFT_1595491 [Trametes sanguinea]|nr:hypothetical protein FKP32DRAFT_1595491 [Trametes sanguinea]
MSTNANTNTTTTSSAKPTPGQSAGAGLGNVVKGAFQTVQGIGESIRGNAMDFVDTATGTGGRHTETDVGRVQTEQGINRMEAGRNAPPTSTQPGAATTTTGNAQGAVGTQNPSQPR